MNLREGIPHFKEGMKLLVAASLGAMLMGSWTLSRPTPKAAYMATDGMMYIPMFVAFFAGLIWLAVDIDDWADIDVQDYL